MRLSNSRITNAPRRPLRKRNTHVVSIIYSKSFSFSPPGQFQLSGGGPEITHRMRRRDLSGGGQMLALRSRSRPTPSLRQQSRQRCTSVVFFCFFFKFSACVEWSKAQTHKQKTAVSGRGRDQNATCDPLTPDNSVM